MELIETKDNLLQKAKQLKPVEILQLIDSLLESLHIPNEEIEKLWIKEADARFEAYKRGDLKSTDWEEIRKKYE